MAKILLVDDDVTSKIFYENLLQKLEHNVVTFSDPLTVLSQASADAEFLSGFDLFVFDVYMPELSGLDLVKKLKSYTYQTPVLLFTGDANIDDAVEGLRLGAHDYMIKNFDEPDKFCQIVGKALSHRKVLIENAKNKNSKINTTVETRSNLMKVVINHAQIASESDATVLITGESGTGKEIYARYIHSESGRSNEEFISVNCSAIPSELIESELFGHVKGAFTGASHDRVGLFEQANNGTLFLDEIGEMELHLQSKLLKVIQDREIRPVGSSQKIKIDVRLIAATNRTLKEEIQKKNFREDLFYRLNVISLKIPALRERSEDIPMLAYHFLNKYCDQYKKECRNLTPKSLELLELQKWEGNVRELENAIERAVIFSKSDLIEPKDLKLNLSILNENSDSLFQFDRVYSLKELEHVYTQMVLDYNKGDLDQTAQDLGVSKRSVYRKIKEITESKAESTPLN